jgi:hypothetical protein
MHMHMHMHMCMCIYHTIPQVTAIGGSSSRSGLRSTRTSSAGRR